MDAGRSLLTHGTIVLFIGVLCGFPFWFAITRGRGQTGMRAWRVAHSTLIASGLVLIVTSLVLPRITMGATLLFVLSAALVVSAWGFTFAMVVGAWTGRRGLVPTGSAFDKLLFAGHLAGAVGAVVGLALLLMGLLA